MQSLTRKGLLAYDDYSIAIFYKNKKMKLIRNYNTNEDVLVVRKSDYQNNDIGNGYFIVQKEEWLYKNDGCNSFHPFLTKK